MGALSNIPLLTTPNANAKYPVLYQQYFTTTGFPKYTTTSIQNIQIHCSKYSINIFSQQRIGTYTIVLMFPKYVTQ